MQTQKSSLEKLYKDNEFTKSALADFRHQLITNMYRSLLDRESYRKRVKKLIQIYRNKNLPVSMKAVEYSVKMYDKIEKRNVDNVIESENLASVSAAFAYLIMNKYKVNDNLRVIEDEEQRKILGEEKEAFIMSEIQENRMERKYFYLCSSHSDSAKDHAPYQGKVYIDEECDDYKCLMLARQYHMVTYQWVIGKPVWMVTRPNCRHYFKALTYSEVAGKSYDSLIEEHKMHRKIGERGDRIQTINSRGKKVQFVIKSYEDRLRCHQDLYRVRPNEMLKRAIEKDVLLIRKWKKSI